MPRFYCSHLAGASLIALAVCPVAGAAQTVAKVDKSVPPSEAGQTRTPALPTVVSYPAKAAGDGTTTAGYNPSRWTEDWSAMARPAKRNDPLDRLKFLPLGPDDRFYVTLSGELRLRVNLLTAPGLKPGADQRQDINRIFAGGDVHLGPLVRFYGELAHGGLVGHNLGTPGATVRNDLIVQQAFGEVRGTLGGMAVGARYGRQEFTDGSSLLISQRDNNTIRTVVNGVRGWARTATVRGDAFDFHMTRYGTEGTGDDQVDRDRRFSGITAGVALPKTLFGTSALFLDPFVWRLRNRATVWGTTSTREERTYYGARLWGEAGRAIVDWTVNHQSGQAGSRGIDAWQVFAAQTLRLGASATAPRVGAHLDYASGG